MVREMAEMTCLACGRNLGRVEKVDNRLRWIPAAESPNAAALVRAKGAGLLCGRCHGRAVMGPLERVVSYAA